MAGLLVTFIVSGRLVSRTGRYKIFPILGTAVTGLGLALLATMHPNTSYAVIALFMFVVGLGLGLVMQVLVVAVQNAVPHARLGTATSTATFFRTIGGAFGVAVLGAVFNNRLFNNPAFAALRANAPASVKHLLQGGSISANPAVINKLPPEAKAVIVDAFNHALQSVYIVAVPFAIGAFFLCFFLKEVPLRTHAFVSAQGRPGDATSGHTNGAIDADHTSSESGGEAADEPVDNVVEVPSL
jgi:MFS family permease